MNSTKKADLMKELKVGRTMPIQLQIVAGTIYDVAYEDGREEGFAEGVRKGAESAMGKLEEAYSSGMQDANKVGSASFLACTALALHELYGFAALRCKRVIDLVSDKLLTTLHPAQWVEECRKIGVVIEDEDMLLELDGGIEDA